MVGMFPPGGWIGSLAFRWIARSTGGGAQIASAPQERALFAVTGSPMNQ
jgi:hypothetical protein